MQTNTSVLALDVGAKRIGVAIASSIARLAHPLTTIENTDQFFAQLKDIVKTEDIDAVVVGLPRNLRGESTDQTRAVEDFVAELKTQIDIPVHLQDEALTSRKAETELEARGKSYTRGDIDALAATYILEDFLAAQPNGMETDNV